MKTKKNYNAKELREICLNKDYMKDFIEFFIEKQESEFNKESSFVGSMYRNTVELPAFMFLDTVFALAESPIEIIFLNSLLVHSIKNMVWIFVHQTKNNAINDVKATRDYFSKFNKMIRWFEKRSGKKGLDIISPLDSYLEEEINKGKLSKEEKIYISRLAWEQYSGLCESNFHLTLQPKLHFEKDGKEITYRPDLYFWNLANPNINIIVECDGFKYHSNHKTFNNDRQKDRMLQKNGFKVLRYSGSEIHQDPIAVSDDILDYLLLTREQDIN